MNEEILKVCRGLKAFEKRQPNDAVKDIARRLRGNLEFAAKGGSQPGFGFVLAEQVAALEAARRE